jgi:hypothetical protein
VKERGNMKNIVAAVVCLVLFATVANASDIRFYQSATNAVTGVPAEYLTSTDLVVNPPGVSYLWAAVRWVNEDPGDDVWIAILFNFSPAPDAGVMYNPSFCGSKRWETASDFNPTGDGNIGLVAVTTQGLGSLGDPKFYYDVPNAMKHYLVGELTYNTPVGGVGAYLGAVARRGPIPGQDTVCFGFGHPGWPSNGPGGNVYFSVIPEPASMLLLGLAGLALRRR